MRSRNEVMTPEVTGADFVTCGGGPPGDQNGELAQLHADLRDFLQHVIDMSKGDHYWDVVRGNAEALLRRDGVWCIPGAVMLPATRPKRWRGLTAPARTMPKDQR